MPRLILLGVGFDREAVRETAEKLHALIVRLESGK
jgi:hypothetical protein